MQPRRNAASCVQSGRRFARVGAAGVPVSCCARGQAQRRAARDGQLGCGAALRSTDFRAQCIHGQLSHMPDSRGSDTDFFFLRALSLRAPLTLRQADICVREDKARYPPANIDAGFALCTTDLIAV